MPKQKTKKATKKRFKVSSTGKISFIHTNRSHRAFGKTTKQKRHLRTPDAALPPQYNKLVKRALPYMNKKGAR